MKPVSLQPSLDNLLKHDGPAGLVVFLVALPLCLGIALASGAPLLGGIIAGCVGGLIISFLSGSSVSVSGPAAGLAVIVATAIMQLGSYNRFLTAVVLAGLAQMLLGFFRLGNIADYVPHCVIKGMLAAIGLVIILKQIPHALGRDQDYEGDFEFFEMEGLNTFTDIIEGFITAQPGAVIISVLGLVLLVCWDWIATKGVRWMQMIPGPLMAVLLGIGLNQLFGQIMPSIKLMEAEHMVTLPGGAGSSGLMAQMAFPDWTALGDRAVWMVAFTIAIVASLESLLSLEAADKLDPYRRISPTHRELVAQGIGNTVSGLLGGLPVTNVVVRTTANVYAGARTWVSSFVHGVLLLIATVLIPQVLNLTPLASLAAVLIVVGYRLTKPALYRQMYSQGWDQFLPFLSTVLAVVFTDLLKGVLLGLGVALLFVLKENRHDALTVVNLDQTYLIRLNKDATFVNKSEFRTKLREIPEGSHVIIDGTRALYIDEDIYEVAGDFRKLASYKNITIEMKNFDE